MNKPNVAIIDYGLGNLFSVKHACTFVGMDSMITNDHQTILESDAIILPGIGAFRDAMTSLRALKLDVLLRNIASSGKPIFGVCLGMQLLMDESHEFGHHQGLGLIEGEVVRFEFEKTIGSPLKVPQVGWNKIRKPQTASNKDWEDALFSGLEDETFMYFVHSFYAKPAEENVVSAFTTFGDIRYSSALRKGNVYATQFHPERSGEEGLKIYKNLANLLHTSSH